MSEFTVGTRVIVQNLQSAKQYNKKHGTVAKILNEKTGRIGIDLDTCPTSSRLSLKPTNLILEGEIMSSRKSSRAEIDRGVLREDHGRAVCQMLDIIRYTAAQVLVHEPSIQSIQDVEDLRDQGMEGTYKQNQLTTLAYSHWKDTRKNGLGVYSQIKYFVEKSLEENPPMLEAPQWQILHRSLEDVAATGSWDFRVHGKFWIVDEASDGSGTYLVSEKENAVYKALGIADAIYSGLIQPRYGDRPLIQSITLLPWHGRLVYDGILTSPIRGIPAQASDNQARKLRSIVQLAEDEGRVIDRLRELELEDSHLRMHQYDKKDNIPAHLVDSDMPELDAPSQEAITKLERKVMKAIKSYAPTLPSEASEDEKKPYWLFRRDGYTEHENPNHEGFIMYGQPALKPPGDAFFPIDPIGMFKCSSLEPTSTEILIPLLACAKQMNFLPEKILIDEEECCERVEYLFKESQINVEFEYYPPPTVEEHNAYNNAHPAPLFG